MNLSEHEFVLIIEVTSDSRESEANALIKLCDQFRDAQVGEPKLIGDYAQIELSPETAIEKLDAASSLADAHFETSGDVVYVAIIRQTISTSI